MKLETYVKKLELLKKNEIDKVKYLAYYFYANGNIEQFTISDIKEWFDLLNLSQPNVSRLKTNLKKSRSFIKGTIDGSFRLHATEIDTLNNQFKIDIIESEEIISDDIILPESLYKKTRGFIELLSKQINASYENNIFDGCAVLMRRLIEILLILSYQNNGIENNIVDSDGNYKQLSKIIGEAKTNTTLNLSKETKDVIDNFRIIGIFSAHKIYYNCKKNDIKPIILNYRATIEELLYKCGIRT